MLWYNNSKRRAIPSEKQGVKKMTDAREILIEKMADNLPVLRKKLKLSQEGLADIIGSSRYTVMLIETKKRKMTWSTYMALVLLFEKSADTEMLLRAFNIYTEELDAYLSRKSGSVM